METKIIFRIKVNSQRAAFPTLFPGDTAILVKAKALVKLRPKKYVYTTVIIHPTTGRKVCVPEYSWGYMKLVDGQWIDPPGLGSQMWGDDHNPDIWNKHDR